VGPRGWSEVLSSGTERALAWQAIRIMQEDPRQYFSDLRRLGQVSSSSGMFMLREGMVGSMLGTGSNLLGAKWSTLV
jgi:hypothetical protein